MKQVLLSPFLFMFCSTKFLPHAYNLINLSLLLLHSFSRKLRGQEKSFSFLKISLFQSSLTNTLGQGSQLLVVGDPQNTMTHNLATHILVICETEIFSTILPDTKMNNSQNCRKETTENNR